MAKLKIIQTCSLLFCHFKMGEQRNEVLLFEKVSLKRITNLISLNELSESFCSLAAVSSSPVTPTPFYRV